MKKKTPCLAIHSDVALHTQLLANTPPVKREKLLYPPTCITFNGVRVPYECYLDAVANRKVGDVVRSYAGAPGTGYVDHRITRIDATGVYAVIVPNTIRELEPWEVV